jgi:hypothetical protein
MPLQTRYADSGTGRVASQVGIALGRYDAQLHAIVDAAGDLPGRWTVEPHLDYEGNVSIVLIPGSENEGGSIFALYPGADAVEVAVLHSEHYAKLGSFQSVAAAMQHITVAGAAM